MTAKIQRGEFFATYEEGKWESNDPMFKVEAEAATDPNWETDYAPNIENRVAQMVAATIGATVVQVNPPQAYDENVEY